MTARFSSTLRTVALFTIAPIAVLAPLGCSSNSAGQPTISANTAGISNETASTASPAPDLAPADQTVPDWSQGQVITHIPVKEKVFALTFDDGPWPKSTEEMLHVLADNDVKATFFMVGREAKRRPQVAKAVLAAGMAIGNHSWDHPSRPKDPVKQVEDTNDELQQVLGFRPNMFRPPYGIVTNGMARQAIRDHQAVILWNCSAADWDKPGAGSIASMTIAQARPGGIALLHDGGGNRSQTIEAVTRIIRELRDKGYRFVTIPELLRMHEAETPIPEVDRKLTAKAGK